MKWAFSLLFLAGCTEPRVQNFYVTIPPTAPVTVERKAAPASAPAVLAVVRHRNHLVAEADRYLNYDKSRPAIIIELAELRAEADKAVADYVAHPRSPAAKAAARQKVETLSTYLQNKPDSRKTSSTAPETIPQTPGTAVDDILSSSGKPPVAAGNPRQ
jgi:hypothetical protein